jgi:hypothetical protein
MNPEETKTTNPTTTTLEIGAEQWRTTAENGRRIVREALTKATAELPENVRAPMQKWILTTVAQDNDAYEALRRDIENPNPLRRAWQSIVAQ